ncbi:MAG: DUF6089 family protein [Bacteroidales bacterium]|nr:DUF6089 family protein [Bacteroidales bacterium]
MGKLNIKNKVTGTSFYCSVRSLFSVVKAFRFAFFIALLLAFQQVHLQAQEHYDPGLFAGTSYYMGDLNPTMHYRAPSFAIGPVLRYNFNNYNSLRAHAIYHGLSGAASDYQGYLISEGLRDFGAKFVDLGLDFEFNWKAYRTAHRKSNGTPYVFAGIGYGLVIARSSNENVRSHITMPFGLGYKLNLGRWLSGGLELGARKAFSDYVDGFINPPLENEIAFFGNKDWYFFTGVFITYKFFKFWEDCPTYDNIHKY